MAIILKEYSEDLTHKVTNFESLPKQLVGDVTGYGITLNIDVDTPAAVTFDSGVASSLVVQDLTYTAVDRGVGGDAITIAYTGGATAGAEVVSVAGNAISIQIENGVSTATQIKTAFDLVAAATALASVAVSGVGANAQNTAAATPLAGGVDPEVDTATEYLSIPSHGLTTGLKGQLTTTGTLPAGLALATDYFVIVVDDDNIQLASSLNNALAGTAINITSQGASGSVNTFTATAIAGGTYKVQVSIDGDTYVDLAAATNITADVKVFLDEVDPLYNWIKLVYTLTAGRVSVEERVVVKGN